jgi:hypothetical protein
MQPRDQVRFAAAQAEFVREPLRFSTASGRSNCLFEPGRLRSRFDVEYTRGQERDIPLETLLTLAVAFEPERDAGQFLAQRPHVRFQFSTACVQARDSDHGAHGAAERRHRENARENHESRTEVER